MLLIPYAPKTGDSYCVVIVMDDSNLERLKAHDPGELDLRKVGEPFVHMKLMGVQIAHEDADGMKHVIELMGRGKAQEALQFLFRGFKYRPDLGDDDAAYLSLSGKPS